MKAAEPRLGADLDRVKATSSLNPNELATENGQAFFPSHTGAIPALDRRNGEQNDGETRVRKSSRIQWFLRHYPTIGVILSLCISIPLVVFKYNLAKQNERQRAEQTFQSTAVSLFLTLSKDFQFASIAPLLLAQFSIAAPGPLSAKQFRMFTDSTGYFSTISSGFSVGLYQHATNATVDYWRQQMFLEHGGNFGSNNSFSFFDKNGTTPIINNNRSDFFFTFHLLGDETSPVKNSLGFIANSDPETRLPLIQYLREVGEPTVTGRLTLVTSTTPTGVLISGPIFKNSTPDGVRFASSRTDDMDGFASAGVDVAAMLSSRLTTMDLDPVDSLGEPSKSMLGHFSVESFPPLEQQLAYYNTTEGSLASFSQELSFALELDVLNREGYVSHSQTSFPMRLLGLSLIEPLFSILFHVSIFGVHRLWPHAKKH
ncbi:hypothetical protein DFJ73DRAFT_816227 [Zopfochytrium polystomum]|nr:hypothetical protein DFJ73DRAFT_816227 [Zopfochytrium polystomum]